MKLLLGPVLACVVTASCFAQSPNWTRVQPAASPVARSYHCMSYDSDRQVIVLFGGRDAVINRLGDTWEYDGKAWKEIRPSVFPSAREDHLMVYDSVRKVTVLFGGLMQRDTWTWDGVVWTKVKIPPAQKPSARSSFSMAFDEARGKTVLFGGYDVTKGLVDDTWEFDGVVWTQVRSATTTPLPRREHGMAYDSVRRRIVLFGGAGDTRQLGDTWEWDGKVWTEVTSTNPTPAPRVLDRGGLAYDSNRRRVVLYGGYSFQRLNETWEFDGKDWARITTATVPSYRQGFSSAFDAARGRLVVFSGAAANTDLWEYSGSGCYMTADVATIAYATGGTQTLTLDAGPVHANKSYWIFGSITGTSPGVSLNGIHIPLNLDVYTQLAMENVTANPPYDRFRATLDASGGATARFVLPVNTLNAGFSLDHSYIVFDGAGMFYGASNPVQVTFQ